MKILKFIGSAILGIVISYLLWLIFHFATPWVMSFGWIGVIVSIICASFITGIFASICSWVLLPLMLMVDNFASKILPTVAMLFHGFSAARQVWGLDMEYTASKITLGIILTILVVAVFVSAIQCIWANPGKGLNK